MFFLFFFRNFFVAFRQSSAFFYFYFFFLSFLFPFFVFSLLSSFLCSFLSSLFCFPFHSSFFWKFWKGLIGFYSKVVLIFFFCLRCTTEKKIVSSDLNHFCLVLVYFFVQNKNWTCRVRRGTTWPWKTLGNFSFCAELSRGAALFAVFWDASTVTKAPCPNGGCEKQAKFSPGSNLGRNEVKSKTSTVQGELGKQKKKSISSRKKRLHTCTTCFENSEICEETQPSVYPQPLSKVRLPLSPIVMQFWKDEKISLGKKGGREWTGNPRIFLGKCWVGSALYFLSGWVCAAFVPLSKRPENWRDVFRRSDYPKFHKVLFLHSDIQDLHRATKKKKWFITAFFCLKTSSLTRFSNCGIFGGKKKLACFLACFFFCSFQVFFEFSFKQNSASFLPSCISFL